MNRISLVVRWSCYALLCLLSILSGLLAFGLLVWVITTLVMSIELSAHVGVYQASVLAAKVNVQAIPIFFFSLALCWGTAVAARQTRKALTLTDKQQLENA